MWWSAQLRLVSAYCSKLALEIGIAERVQFLGPRPVERLQGYLTQADILISPRTLGGNTPMKVYSYMQAGKAILATDIRSHSQVLDRECAALVQPDAHSFADALARLALDSNLRMRLGQAALVKVEREFSLPVFRRRLKEAYEKLERSIGPTAENRSARSLVRALRKPWLCQAKFHVWQVEPVDSQVVRTRCVRCSEEKVWPVNS